MLKKTGSSIRRVYMMRILLSEARNHHGSDWASLGSLNKTSRQPHKTRGNVQVTRMKIVLNR